MQGKQTPDRETPEAPKRAARGAAKTEKSPEYPREKPTTQLTSVCNLRTAMEMRTRQSKSPN